MQKIYDLQNVLPQRQYGKLEVSTGYEKGGYSYFTYKQKPRCYFLTMKNLDIVTLDNGHSIRSYSMFDNATQHIVLKEVTRKNDRLHDKIDTIVSKYADEIARIYDESMFSPAIGEIIEKIQLEVSQLK